MKIDIRVYYEDTDAGGVVYYANYLKFCERGRTEFLRAAGFENTSIRAEKGLIFVVRSLQANYHKPSRLDDLLTLETLADGVGNSSFMMKQAITRDGVLVFDMTVQLVCVNEQGRPTRVPDDLKAVLAGKG